MIADLVASALAAGAFTVVLGGDCSIVLGGLLGAQRAGRRAPGLVYLDAHADFGTPGESRSGSRKHVSRLAVGRGDASLARLGAAPLVEPSRVALVGRRDYGEEWYGHAVLRRSAILDLDDETLRQRPMESNVQAVLERIASAETDGYWIHLDADLLSPEVMPAVDSPTPGGLDVEQVITLLRPLLRHPKAIGLEVTICDPSRDPGRQCAHTFVDLFARAGRQSGRAEEINQG